MEIQMFNQNEIQRFKTDKTHIVISFQEPNCEFVPLPVQDSRIGYIGVHCYDLDKDTGIFPYSKFVFNFKQAQDILTMVEATMELAELICVNCVAGQSRSVGCAGALAKIYNNDDTPFFKNKTPNMLIYSTILKEYYEAKS